ncbi:hypothetical protein [Marimonas arenosa]|uniref:hypothetical protein n=1 Tax=Marimonas arenosa TaxID=1795305 RepID=UPI0027D21CCB|nr:hypothetical protein [Marimonas arenosa]
MLRVLEYIHTNPAGDLPLDALADVAAMSRIHCRRVFHAMTGETCAEAVRRSRLSRPACWLVQSDWPATELRAYAVFELAEGVAMSEGFEPVDIPGGRVARLRFRGPSAGLHRGHDHLFGGCRGRRATPAMRRPMWFFSTRRSMRHRPIC